MRSLRAWDDQLEKMLYANIEQFDDMLGYRFSEHFETDKPIYQWGTELKDKNGVEIYEGDIMDYFTYVLCKERKKGIVCFDINQSRYKIVPFDMYVLNAGNGGWTGHAFDNNICLNSEVIGNIHEHPHLLNLPGEVDHD